MRCGKLRFHQAPIMFALLLTYRMTGQDSRLKSPPPPPQPVPRMQVIPMPDYQASFQRDGLEVARYYFNPSLNRPFLFPVIGPSGRSLTRIGHPQDPDGHSHHNSVWIAHNDVNGVNFWADRGGTGRIIHQKIEQYVDGPDAASIASINAWTSNAGAVLLTEHRRITLHSLPDGELMLLIDLLLEPKGETVTFGKTPFGLIGTRMAKTIGVYDGGGAIRNSEGSVDEPQVFWKQARWVDYSGPITPTASEGITLFDHPANPNHPSYFHVRRDGWMGGSLTLNEAKSITRSEPLRVRYGLYVHRGIPGLPAIEAKWKEFAGAGLPALVKPRTAN